MEGHAAGTANQTSVGLLRKRLQLIRPANLPTAAADILAGFAVAGLPAGQGIGWLVLASVLLYASGVALNDFFDAELDAIERPERPIPSGMVARASAFWLGLLLLAAGIGAAFAVSMLSGTLALALGYLVLLYNRLAKHTKSMGPVFMGLCRGANLCLGLSIVPAVLVQYWLLALIPVLYIGAVTSVSLGEVSGGSGVRERRAAIALAAALAALAGVTLLPGARAPDAAPFLVLLTVVVVPSYIRAAMRPEAGVIRAAVRAGVLSIVLVDAVLASAFAGPVAGALVGGLAGLSWAMSKLYAVT